MTNSIQARHELRHSTPIHATPTPKDVPADAARFALRMAKDACRRVHVVRTADGEHGVDVLDTGAMMRRRAFGKRCELIATARPDGAWA